MEPSEKGKHFLGYFVGIIIFVITIPFLIYIISQVEIQFLQIQFFNSEIIKLIIVIPIFCVGILFTIWSNIDLFMKGKGGPTDIFNIEISPRTKMLVITGPYKYTRNPMVFGVYSIYLSLALFLNSLIGIIFCGLLFLVIVIYIKQTEEKRLLKDFGEEYIQYKKKVSIIIPFPKKKLRH